jgi:hypothetical protein
MLKKYWYFCIIVILVISSFFIQIPPRRELSYQTIERVSKGSEDATKEVVVYDKKAFEELWNRIHSNRKRIPALPDVDFQTQMVIGVFSGTAPTGGYSTKITGVTEKRRILEVQVKELTPGSECIVSQAQTSPYHLISTPKMKKKLFFLKSKSSGCKE